MFEPYFYWTPDFINGMFELIGGMFLWLNVRRILIDKQVKGVSYFPIVFFTLWGFWNLFFYPRVGAMWSYYCGFNVVIANTVWLGLLIHYSDWIKKHVD